MTIFIFSYAFRWVSRFALFEVEEPIIASFYFKNFNQLDGFYGVYQYCISVSRLQYN